MKRFTIAVAFLALIGMARPARAPAQQHAAPSPLAGAMQRRTLGNGLEVIVVHNPSVPLATALVAVHSGAFTQDSSEAGLAHLYEHLLFRSFGGSATAFGWQVTKLNGTYNGSTSQEYVDYYVMVPSGNIESAIGLLADLMRKARFSNGSLKEERPIVLDELQRNVSDPEGELQRRLDRMLWGTSRHRKDVSGDSSSLELISLEHLRATYARYYVPNNAALIITGDVDAERVFTRAEREFGAWQRGADPFADRPIPPIEMLSSNAAVLVARDMHDVTIVVSLQGPSVGRDPGATYAADVLFDVLNDPSSAFQGRLVDHGPFRSISGQYVTQQHVGPIELRGKTTPELAQQALLALLDELDRLDQLQGVTDEDLSIAKKRRQVSTALMLESTAFLAPRLAFWWSSTGIDYFVHYDEQMAVQTIDSLRRFAQRYVVGKPRVIGILGAPDIISQLTNWLRQGARQSQPAQAPRP